MDEGIQEPVAEGPYPQNQGTPPLSPESEVYRAQQDGPPDDPHHAVRDRIVVEVQRGDGGDAGDDADVLEAQQQASGPEQVHELDGQEQRAKGDLRRDPLSGKADGKVTDEHLSSLSLASENQACSYAFKKSSRRIPD